MLSGDGPFSTSYTCAYVQFRRIHKKRRPFFACGKHCGRSDDIGCEWSSDAFPLTVYPWTYNHLMEQSTDLFLMKSTAGQLPQKMTILPQKYDSLPAHS